MKNREDYTREFHEAFGQGIEEDPKIEVLKLRKNLISEETREFFEELDKVIGLLEKGEQIPNELYVDMLKELADMQVVLSGTAVAIKQLRNLEEAFIRVHQSNMSKLGEDGKPILREDGKILKGPNYFKPDLSDLI